MIIYKLPECRVIDKLPEGCAIALGNFDGVHRGHQKLFEFAGEKGHKKTAWTFTSLAKPGVSVPYLTDMRSKLEYFIQYGLDYAVFEDFDAIRNIAYDEFIKEYLVDTLKPARVVCGFNFRFGRGGLGTAEKLKEVLPQYGVDIDILQPVLHNNKVVSSSSIRSAVLIGDMEEASDLLGHPFSLKLPVVEGKKLGRKLGIPTINQNFPNGHIVPKNGIYACSAFVDGKKYIAVTNVGVRPTVSDEFSTVNCETHIINYNGDLYGREVKVDFYKLLRDEMKFDSIDSLTTQINKDIENTKSYFGI